MKILIKKMFVLTFVVSIIFNIIIVVKIVSPYIKLRMLVNKEIADREEYSQYKIRDIKKEIKWTVHFENPRSTILGDHFSVIVENDDITFCPGW